MFGFLLIALAIATEVPCMLNEYDLSAMHNTKADYVFNSEKMGSLYINMCGDVNYDYSKAGTESQSSVYVDGGEITPAGATNTQLIDDDGDHVTFEYSSTTQCANKRFLVTKIKASCGGKNEISEVSLDRTQCQITVKMTHDEVCKYIKDRDGSSFPIIGLILCALLVVAVCAYFAIGVVVDILLLHKRGLEIIPNFAFWKSLPLLLVDGFLFTFLCRKSERVSGSETQQEPLIN